MKRLWNSCCVEAVLMTIQLLNFDAPMMTLHSVFGQRSAFLMAVLLCFSWIPASAQEDPAADALLSRVSETMKGYSSVHATYVSTMIDRQSDFEMEQTGEVWLQEEQYHLELGEYTIICDGRTVWTYDPEMGECYVDDADAIAEDGIDPARMFTIWEEGFKKTLKGEENLDGKTVARVDLNPTGAKDNGYHTIQCFIDKVKWEVVQLVVKGRDGTDVVYSIGSLVGTGEVPEGAFTFDPAQYPGATIIDNRL